MCMAWLEASKIIDFCIVSHKLQVLARVVLYVLTKSSADTRRYSSAQPVSLELNISA